MIHTYKDKSFVHNLYMLFLYNVSLRMYNKSVDMFTIQLDYPKKKLR